MVSPTQSEIAQSDIAETLVSKLDFGDPLYLHASDTVGTSIVGMKLIGTENYNIWSCAFTLALETKNKLGFIDGTVIKSDDDEVLSKQWDRCNAVVLSWILASVSEELYVGQIFSKQASVVWQELKETYDKGDGSITFNLHRKINSLSQNGTSISDYYHKLNSLWKQFDALVKLPTCTCHASKEFSDHNQLIKLMQFLMGLDDVYLPIRSNILTRDPLPSVKTAFAIISREESHRGVSSFNSVSKGNTQPSAFVAKAFNNKSKFNRGPNPNLKCTHCNMIGHTIDRCYELVGYPTGYKKKGFGNQVNEKQVVINNAKANLSSNMPSTSTNASPFTSEQLNLIMSMINEKKKTENIQANMAGFQYQENSGDW